VRIARSTKQAGDAELARAGISPSRAVRGLWQHLAEDGIEGAAEILDLPAKSATSAAVSTKSGEALPRMFGRFEAFGKEWGLDPSDLPSTDDTALRTHVMDEKRAHWSARGIA